MSDIPECERAAFERAKALSQSVFEMAESMDFSDRQFSLDLEAIIEADLRWQAGDHELRAIGPLLRIARLIGIEPLKYVHDLVSPYSTSRYTISAERRPPGRRPKSDGRTPRRYARAAETFQRTVEIQDRILRGQFGERVQELRSSNMLKTPAIIQAGQEIYPGKSERWLKDQHKIFASESEQKAFIGTPELFGLLMRAGPKHALADLPGKVGRPAKPK